jgi:hypothetical protein
MYRQMIHCASGLHRKLRFSRRRMSVPGRSVAHMEQKWIGIGIGHGNREVERALNAAGFMCARRQLLGQTEMKVLIRTDTSDREEVERILRRVNGKDAWISPIAGTPTHQFPGYRSSSPGASMPREDAPGQSSRQCM